MSRDARDVDQRGYSDTVQVSADTQMHQKGVGSQIQFRPILQTQRGIAEPPASHINKLERVVLAQQLVIAENINLEKGTK